MKYRLLKDMPGSIKGTIFNKKEEEDRIPHGREGQYAPVKKIFPLIYGKDILDKEWFEPVNEFPKSWEELGHVDGVYISSQCELHQ